MTDSSTRFGLRGSLGCLVLPSEALSVLHEVCLVMHSLKGRQRPIQALR